MALVTAVVMLALIEYFIFSLQVGSARGRFGVDAPATTGNVEFERYYRAAANTGEQLLMFIPGMYAFGYYVHPTGAAAAGLLFIAARALYFRTYVADAANDRRACRRFLKPLSSPCGKSSRALAGWFARAVPALSSGRNRVLRLPGRLRPR